MILIGLESLIDIRSVLAMPALSNPRGGEEAEQSTSWGVTRGETEEKVQSDLSSGRRKKSRPSGGRSQGDGRF